MKFAKRVFRMLLIGFLLAALFATAVYSAVAADTSTMSLFDSYSSSSGTFTLASDARIFVVSVDEPTGMLLSTIQLASSRMAAMGLPSSTALRITYGETKDIRDGDIVVQEDSNLEEESFRLEITTTNVTIFYGTGTALSYYGGESSYNGLHYGFQAVMRLFSNNMADCCTAADAPDTRERTVQLDIGRKYWPVNWIKNFIDEMSWMGYNTMDLHLTEDQGCRANIWRDSNGNVVSDCNGNDFNWMIGYNVVSWNRNYTDPNADRFYNRDELTEIVEYAKSRHIEIIPAIDYPTHADCLIAKFASSFTDTGTDFSFNYGGRTYSGRSSLAGGNNATIDVTDEYTRNMSFAITQAYADFFGKFGCRKFNIGGDEVSGASYRWASSSYNTSNGGSSSNYKDAYVIYMNQLAAVVKAKVYGEDHHGYTVRAWNDSLFGTGYYYYNSNGYQVRYWSSATVSVDPDIEVCFWTASSDHDSPSTLTNQGRTVYNCVNWYTYYVLRNNSTYGDARDDNCTQWTFNHGRAKWVYSGCGNTCAYNSCTNTGGWYPGSFNGCTSDCFTGEYVTNEMLGGGYFLIWGDWAGWDTEENIWNRTDNYGIIDRMWANAAKQWNWDIDWSLDYDGFVSMNQSYRTFPGFNGCTAEATVPAPGEVYLDGSLQVEIKTMIGIKEKLLDTIPVEAGYGEPYQVQIPQYSGYAYSTTEGATFTRSAFGVCCGTVSGTVKAGTQTVTVWFENSPYLAGLELLLKNPVANDGYANYDAYEAALTSARNFYQRVSSAPKAMTEQEIVDEYVLNLLKARIALAKEGTDLAMSCYLESTCVVAGKVAVIHVDGGSNVTDVNVKLNGEPVERLRLASRQNADGSKSWRVNIRVPETAGSYNYTVVATKVNGTTETGQVVVAVK